LKLLKERSAAVKTYAVVDSASASRNAIRKRTSRGPGKPQRECVALTDLTDCLLEAYDCVARRAYENFLARGLTPGGELEDWVRAERELLMDFTINVHDSSEFVYAMASVPDATAACLEIGIESRWLVILAQPSPTPRTRRAEIVPDVTRVSAVGPSGRGRKARGAEVSGREEPRSDTVRGTAPRTEDDRPPSKSVCIIELPADVDAANSIAVLADGLLAVRMPKINSRR
jgi:hypothetical protein